MNFDIPVIDGVPFPEAYGQPDQWAPLRQKASPMDTYGKESSDMLDVLFSATKNDK